MSSTLSDRYWSLPAAEREARWRRKYGHIHTDERKTFVYFLYSAGGTCLYIGRSVNPESRWKSHQADVNKPWTDQVAVFRKWGPFIHRDACRIEREQIELHQPEGNNQFTKNGWKRAPGQGASASPESVAASCCADCVSELAETSEATA